MPRTLTGSRLSVGPSRRLVLALAAITLVSAGSLSWLGWEILRQNADVEAQREQERLEHQTDLAVQFLERHLAEAEDRLADWVNRPSAPVPEPGDGGIIVTFTSTAIFPNPSSGLLFYPEVFHKLEAPLRLFDEGEAAEFLEHNPQRALQIYQQLAQSTEEVVRAGALMRLGRTLRAASRAADSLAVYDRMAALGDAPVVGLPADLVARSARIAALAESGQQEAARDEARTFARDLTESRWRLTRGQYEYYLEMATNAAGDAPTVSRDDLALATATADLWQAWKSGLPSSGRRSLQAESIPLMASWRSAPDRIAIWLVRPERLLARISPEPRVQLALSDAEGGVVAGVLDGAGRKAVRTPTDTRLPWTVHAHAVSDSAATSGLTRGRLIAVGLAMMLAFLLAGSYFVGRAIKQEVELGRLQSDFVSAVSHEFRTPLAAMRQLSELLAAGRVPQADRRQWYYESLAGESRRLQRLVENLLNFGRLQAGVRPYRLEPLEPHALVEHVVAEFRAQLSREQCEIEMIGNPECHVRVMADPDALALALHNLLDNAVKYGGPSVTVGWEREGERVAFRVSDRGPGIPTDEQARIFERFIRGSAAMAANVRGTGIGLAMVRQVAVTHGGAVTVESAPGSGSTFTMWLPISQQAA